MAPTMALPIPASDEASAKISKYNATVSTVSYSILALTLVAAAIILAAILRRTKRQQRKWRVVEVARSYFVSRVTLLREAAEAAPYTPGPRILEASEISEMIFKLSSASRAEAASYGLPPGLGDYPKKSAGRAQSNPGLLNSPVAGYGAITTSKSLPSNFASILEDSYGTLAPSPLHISTKTTVELIQSFGRHPAAVAMNTKMTMSSSSSEPNLATYLGSPSERWSDDTVVGMSCDMKRLPSSDGEADPYQFDSLGMERQEEFVPIVIVDERTIKTAVIIPPDVAAPIDSNDCRA